MIFQRTDLLREVKEIFGVLDTPLQYLEESIKVAKNSRGVQGGVISKLDNAIKGIEELVTKEYGVLCQPYEGKEEYIFPYYGKGFVKYQKTRMERVITVYDNIGATLEVRQGLQGIKVEKGRYRNINGLKEVEINWENWLKRKEREKRGVKI